MDVKKVSGVWTVEQHFAFLNRIEESFVRRMPRKRVINVGGGSGPGGEFGLRLDRVLPDSATESNRDHLEKKRRLSSSNSSSRRSQEEEEKEEERETTLEI